MRTTDPLAAITALLESSDPDTVIQCNGITYRVAPSESKREGFFEILNKDRANFIRHNCTFAGQLDADMVKGVAEVLARDSETWFRSARYNESLKATASDQGHPTD